MLNVTKCGEDYTGIEGIRVRWIEFAELLVAIPIWTPFYCHKWTYYLPSRVEFRYRMPLFTINQGELYELK